MLIEIYIPPLSRFGTTQLCYVYIVYIVYHVTVNPIVYYVTYTGHTVEGHNSYVRQVVTVGQCPQYVGRELWPVHVTIA